MSLSKDTEYRLDHAVTDEKIGDEIAARVEVSSTPANDVAAQAILDLLNPSRNAAVAERLYVALAGDGDGAAGKELAKKINGMVAVLQAKADGTEIAATAATASLATTTPIALTSVATGTARNTNTLTLQVLAAAANPTDTILADVTGTAAAIVITITPNDGTNNGATPVDLTTAELVELINTSAVVGKTVTLVDASTLIDDQTATGGDATALADAGEGDGLVATFANGTDASDNDVAPAQEVMGNEPMSESTRNALEHALTSKSAADEFKTSYDAMVVAIQAIV